MGAPHTALAETGSPDADRAGQDAPTPLTDLLVRLIALLVLFLHRRAVRRLHPRLPSRWIERTDLPPGSTQALAAAVRGRFGNVIAWMCLRRGFGPGHPDWDYLSRTIVAFGGSVRGFRAGMPARGLHWFENPEILPGAFGATRPAPAAAAMAGLLARQDTTNARPAVPHVMPAPAGHAAPPPFPGPGFARASMAPPTGPPGAGSGNSVTPDKRGQRMAGPAVLIRASATAAANPAGSPQWISSLPGAQAALPSGLASVPGAGMRPGPGPAGEAPERSRSTGGPG